MEGKRQLEKRDFGKRLSLDSSLVEYMDSNKYIEHLLTQLEEKHRSLWREKLAVARLQREVAERRSEGAMHEKLIHELEEERHLRLQSEKRLQEVTQESERSRIQMRGLQQQFSRPASRVPVPPDAYRGQSSLDVLFPHCQQHFRLRRHENRGLATASLSRSTGSFHGKATSVR